MISEAAAMLVKVPRKMLNGIPWGDLRHAASASLAAAEGRHQEARAQAAMLSDHGGDPGIVAIVAEVLRMSGDPRRAAALAATVTVDGAPSYAAIVSLLTRACIDWDTGNYAAAHVLLEEALGYAASEGIAMPFHKTHESWGLLLEAHTRWGTAFEPFLREMVRKRAPQTGLLAEHQAALSARELQVLALMRTPLSRADIARELFVTENTVKTHQRAIYRKLGVTNRQAAVDAAV